MTHDSRGQLRQLQPRRQARGHGVERQDGPRLGRRDRQARGRGDDARRLRSTPPASAPTASAWSRRRMDKTARVWDAETGKPVGEAMTHGGSVISASFSPDGKRVVTASADKTARVWDAETGKPVGEAMTHGTSVTLRQLQPRRQARGHGVGGQDGPRLGRRDRQARGRGDDARRLGPLRQLQPRRQARGHGVGGQDGPRLGRRDRQAGGRADDARRLGQLRQLQPRRQARGHGVSATRRPASGTPRPASPWARR